MQFLILSLLVAAASATYSYDYSYPQHSYALDSYGSSLYGDHSYGYGGLGSGVSYLLGGHGASNYAPRIHFIRYVPAHTAQLVPLRSSGGKINFVMSPSSTTGRGTELKSTHKGSSSAQPHNPPVWISTKGGTAQSKTSRTAKSVGQTKTHEPAVPPNISIPFRPKLVTPKTTEVPPPVTPPMPEDVPVTTNFPEDIPVTTNFPEDIPVITNFPDDFSNDTVFIEDEPENEIAETPTRPEPLFVEKQQSSWMEEDAHSKLKKASAPVLNDNKDKLNPSSKAFSSRKTVPNADATEKPFHEVTSTPGNIKIGIASKSASSKSPVDKAPISSAKENTSKKTFVAVPDMDYDDFGTLKPTNNGDSKKQVTGGFTGGRKTIVPELSTVYKQMAYKRPLAARLFPQTLRVLTSAPIIPELIMDNPVIEYYYPNQPATITYEYGWMS